MADNSHSPIVLVVCHHLDVFAVVNHLDHSIMSTPSAQICSLGTYVFVANSDMSNARDILWVHAGNFDKDRVLFYLLQGHHQEVVLASQMMKNAAIVSFVQFHFVLVSEMGPSRMNSRQFEQPAIDCKYFCSDNVFLRQHVMSARGSWCHLL